MGKVQITTEGISKFLKSYTEEKSISEYVWNGFDAEADTINIITSSNKIGKIDEVKIIDNGTGIEFEKLYSKFMPFYQSEKNTDGNIKTSKVHGKNGLGRLTFFCFANNAKWETVYNTNNSRVKYEININSNALENYQTQNKKITNEETGTKVTLYNINKIIDVEELKQYLVLEFCWYLKLYPNKVLKLNGEKINYKDNVLDEETLNIENKETKMSFEAEYIQWKEKYTKNIQDTILFNLMEKKGLRKQLH